MEHLQKAHFEKIASEYERHYEDEYSRQYRLKFIEGLMFQGIDLAGRRVLEAMCGSGQTTRYLLSRGAFVTGLDLSPTLIQAYQRRWPGCQAICTSIFDSNLPSESYDCVAIVGGLHHVQPRVNEAITEILRVLKPGGYFCFAEPHKGSLADVVRRIWYRNDPYFERNEDSIDLEDLKAAFNPYFHYKKEFYRGSIAYLGVLNSMILRVPVRWKRYYSPALIAVERALGGLHSRLMSCFVVCQWQKREPPRPAREA